MGQRAVRTGITRDSGLREIAKLAFLDILEVLDADGTHLPLKDMAPDVRAALAGLEITEITNAD